FMPVIGVPLPFFSAGGTAMVTMLSSIGLVLACMKDKVKSK
ncbi:MAG: FtsW/RodA/SpoVE family cell cycle protein, partial [Ruminococcus sp.]|nr:FtsW/RodA/SpoVE family cell cycle protein [Ruminococcus sp.]